MILRLYLIAGLLLLGGTGYFIVVRQEPDFQSVPTVSEITRLQEEGILPTGPFAEDEEVEHGIFEVPPMDEMMLDAAVQNMDMGGMDMGGMDMGAGQPAGDTMTMPDGTAMPMADMPATAPAAGSGMPMAAACTGEGGLGFCPAAAQFDREINLSMSEWTFSDLNIEVKEGERIRFNVRNDGKVLHEFMFMSMPLMQAVEYRARRADWNLLEHEALYEKSLLLPGETLSFVAEVQSTGAWMFMCMLPYHMQMGMMGQIATPGAAMEM